jgi:hypothetical protein
VALAGIVVKFVAKAASWFNKVQQAVLQVAESKEQSHRVFTGDHLRPRQFPVPAGNSLLSSAYVSKRWRHAVETC